MNIFKLNSLVEKWDIRSGILDRLCWNRANNSCSGNFENNLICIRSVVWETDLTCIH